MADSYLSCRKKGVSHEHVLMLFQLVKKVCVKWRCFHTLFFSSFCLCFSSSRALRFSVFSRCSSSFLLRSSSWLSRRRRAFSSFSNHWAFFAAERTREKLRLCTVFNSQRLLFYCSWDLNGVLNWERWQLKIKDDAVPTILNVTTFTILLFVFIYIYITRIVFIFINSASILLFQLLQTFFLY